MRFMWCAALAALLVSAGCGSDGGSEPGDPDVEAVNGAVFTLTQEDDGCTLTGPTEVAAGETYYVAFKNPTDMSATVYVSLLDDGATFEEFVALQPAPGVYFPRPPYIVYATSDPEAAGEFNQAAELADDEVGLAYSSQLGPHAVYTWISEEDALWICGSFEAT